MRYTGNLVRKLKFGVNDGYLCLDNIPIVPRSGAVQGRCAVRLHPEAPAEPRRHVSLQAEEGWAQERSAGLPLCPGRGKQFFFYYYTFFFTFLLLNYFL